MARVGYVSTADAAGDAKEVLRKMEGRGSDVLNLHRAVANSPNALRNFVRLGNSLLVHGALPPVLRELAILRVGQRTGAVYEWAHHVPIARAAGVTKAQIEALDGWESSDGFSGRERALLGYIDSVSSEIRVQDGVFEELRAHLNDAEIVELTLVAGYWGMVARLLVALEIDVEEPFRKYLAR